MCGTSCKQECIGSILPFFKIITLPLLWLHCTSLSLMTITSCICIQTCIWIFVHSNPKNYEQSLCICILCVFVFEIAITFVLVYSSLGGSAEQAAWQLPAIFTPSRTRLHLTMPCKMKMGNVFSTEIQQEIQRHYKDNHSQGVQAWILRIHPWWKRTLRNWPLAIGAMCKEN